MVKKNKIKELVNAPTMAPAEILPAPEGATGGGVGLGATTSTWADAIRNKVMDVAGEGRQGLV